MFDRLPILALLVVASFPGSSGAAALTSRNYSVPSFDRIRIDGPYKVELRTNVSPFARATGSPLSLDGLSVGVEGRTLVVRRGSGGWGGYDGEDRGPVTVEVGTPDLKTAWINGAGALSIDKVRGLSFDLSIQGAGVAKIGSVDVDQLKAGVSGAGSVTLSGRAARLTATIRGTSSFEGDALQVKDAVIGAEGPSTVKANIANSAKVDALGLASVTLTGHPACTVKAQGSAVVTGCKQDGRQ
jgi:Putative auto-transporter adhesin, head GIN domain